MADIQVEFDDRVRLDSPSKRKITCWWLSIISISILLFCTMLPASFVYVEYNEK